MSISLNTLTELKKMTAYFDFLISAPNPKSKTISQEHRICSICHESFDDAAWQPGSPVNQAVKLSCGHLLGIQCLAHLVFTTNFNNRCPLCRAQIIPYPFDRHLSHESFSVTISLLRVLMISGGDDAASFQKKEALELLGAVDRFRSVDYMSGKHMHHVMVLFEEFLNRFCDEERPVSDADRARVAEARVEELRTEGNRMSFQLRNVVKEIAVVKRKAREEVGAAEEGRKKAQDELNACKKELSDARDQALQLGIVLGNGIENELGHSMKHRGNTKAADLKTIEEREGAKKAWSDTTEWFEEIYQDLSGAFFFCSSILFETTTTQALMYLRECMFMTVNPLEAILWLSFVHCIAAMIRGRPSKMTWVISRVIVFFIIWLNAQNGRYV